ncbi:uncharacterized protein LOC132904312 [Amyelois transitella]|uniref:uncharacterized protein LOC132904312 n=1 Tax=Amyelois transitella TaxID=680683 RepID=UPI00298FFE0A|nr:uncharacterized protein LOC132904312 [Amyelois transitella]
MKTSVSQFEMLVNFMEKHGDINKPTKNASGRIQTIQAWDRLTDLLNGDATGEAKTTEKWKKVWSDLKNNTKKKAAKINKGARGTGVGPALQIRLSELEERVLSIIGPQAATGLMGVPEADFFQEPNVTGDTDRTLSLPETLPHVVLESSESPTIFSLPEVGEISRVTHVEIPANEKSVHDVWNEAGPSHQPHVPPPTQTPPPVHQEDIAPTHRQPAQRGQTPRRRHGSPLRRARSPRRRLVGPHSHIEQATQQFISSDEEWRNFLRKKHEDEIELEREKLRIKEKEIEAQHRWQDVTMSAIAALNRIIDSRFLRD